MSEWCFKSQVRVCHFVVINVQFLPNVLRLKKRLANIVHRISLVRLCYVSHPYGLLCILYDLPFIATCTRKAPGSTFLFYNVIPNLLCLPSPLTTFPCLYNSLNMLQFSSELFLSTFGLSCSLNLPLSPLHGPCCHSWNLLFINDHCYFLSIAVSCMQKRSYL